MIAAKRQSAAAPSPESGPELWTAQDIAAYLRVSDDMVLRMAADGRLPRPYVCIPGGRSGRVVRRWKRIDVIAHLEQRFSHQ